MQDKIADTYFLPFSAIGKCRCLINWSKFTEQLTGPPEVEKHLKRLIRDYLCLWGEQRSERVPMWLGCHVGSLSSNEQLWRGAQVGTQHARPPQIALLLADSDTAELGTADGTPPQPAKGRVDDTAPSPEPGNTSEWQANSIIRPHISSSSGPLWPGTWLPYVAGIRFAYSLIIFLTSFG